MNGQWTLVTLVLAAGLITGVSALAVRGVGGGLRRALRSANTRFSFYFGLILGVTAAPLLFLLGLRMSPTFFQWVLAGPFPLNRLDEPAVLLLVAAITVGLPVLALAALQRGKRGNGGR